MPIRSNTRAATRARGRVRAWTKRMETADLIPKEEVAPKQE